jgi:ATP-dependent HslUV protease, peptidase subunit HslV
MTTITLVRRGKQIAIASDSLVTFGDTRLAHGYEINEKVFRVGENLIGMSGSTAHFPVLERALRQLAPERLKMRTRDQVFDTFLELHPKLKENFFLNTKEEDDDPYESSQFTVAIANPWGIFGVYSYREVFEFERFWAIGSGRAFALGAMYAAYDKATSARAVAELGVRAGCEFDKNSGLPVRARTMTIRRD